MNLTLEELNTFFNDRHVSEECPMCRNDAWLVILGKDMSGIGLIIKNTAGDFTSNHLSVIPVICKNCGYVRLHAQGAIKEWMEGKGKTEAGHE